MIFERKILILRGLAGSWLISGINERYGRNRDTLHTFKKWVDLGGLPETPP